MPDSTPLSNPPGEPSTGSKPSSTGSTWRTTRRSNGSEPIRRLGRFEILSALGKGAFGEVWKAYDPHLDRDVALKIPRFEDSSAKEAERFFREARAAGQLHHPHIVAIHDAGLADGQFYIASTFIDGKPLSIWLKDNVPTFAQAAEMIRKLAEAVHCAHTAGIFHRDIKPANIMIDAAGEPHLMDFGMARREDQEATMTTEGAILGTPSYMSPEQAKGQSRQADARSDLYALGVVLYEMLAGKRPFDGPPPVVMHKVIHEEPEPPRKANPRIPFDLETIALKCMAKEPERRYPSAQHLADELRRWLNNEPIQARAAGRIEKTRLWIKRNPVLAIAGGSAIVALLSLTLLASVFGIRERRHGLRLQAETELADQRRRETEMLLARSYIDRAQSECEQGQVDRGLLWMARALRSAQTADSAELEWAIRANLAAWQPQIHPLTNILEHDDAIRTMALSPDGTRVVTGTGDGAVTVWDAKTGAKLARRIQHAGGVSTIELSRDGKLILTAGRDQAVRVIRLETGQIVGDPIQLRANAYATFGPDDHTILTYSDNVFNEAARRFTDVQIWDGTTHRPIGSPIRLQGGGAAHLSPDGRLILTNSGQGFSEATRGEARLYDFQTRQPVGAPMVHEGGIRTAVFSPDGKRILTASYDKTARLWDGTSGQPIGSPWFHDEPVSRASFSADGKKAITIAGPTVRVWDVATGRPIGPTMAVQGDMITAAFSDDGTKALSGGHDFHVHLFDTANGRQIGGSLSHQGLVIAGTFSRDGREVFTASYDASVRVWTLAPTPPANQPTQITFPDTNANHAMVVKKDPATKAFQVFDSKTNSPKGKPLLDSESYFGAILAPDGKTVLGSKRGTFRVWDALTGSPLGPEFGNPAVGNSALAISSDGGIMISGGTDLVARLWQLPSGAPLGSPLPHDDQSLHVAISPDGRLAATAGIRDKTIRLWSTATSKPIGQPFHQNENVLALAFSADGKTLYSQLVKSRTSHAWPMPNPVQGDIERIETWIQAKTGLTMDDDRGIRLLSAADWRRAKDRLAEQGQ